MGLTLAVRPGVLIPRDTAVVVQQALHRLPQGARCWMWAGQRRRRAGHQASAARCPGNGGGYIAARCCAASDNARACGWMSKYCRGWLCAGKGRRFDVIVSNPPISHRGSAAFAAGGAGRACAGAGRRRGRAGFLPQAVWPGAAALKPAGHLVVELGDHQAQDVKHWPGGILRRAGV